MTRLCFPAALNVCLAIACGIAEAARRAMAAGAERHAPWKEHDVVRSVADAA